MNAEADDKMEGRVYNLLLKSVFQSQLLLALIVGLGFFVLSLVTAQALIQAATEELKIIIESNRCVCGSHPNRVEAIGNRITITPDMNSLGSLTREVLRKQGSINDMPGVAGPTSPDKR